MTNLEVCRVGTKAEICEIFGRIYLTAVMKLLKEPSGTLSDSDFAQAAAMSFTTAMYHWLDFEQAYPALTPMEAEKKIKVLLDIENEFKEEESND